MPASRREDERKSDRRFAQRVLGYARVSTAEQAYGASLGDQQAALAAYAEACGLRVEKFYVESESGGREKLERREEIKALLRDARAGDLVLVDKLDRWSRDPEFTYRSVRQLRERGASMFFVAEGMDPSTPSGDSELNFRIIFAREEHKRIRERTTGTRQRMRAKGYFVEGHIPFGYRRSAPKSSRSIDRHVLVVEPEEASVVREIFQLAAQGTRLQDIAERFQFVHQRVLRIIKNRHYLGEVQREKRGEWSKGLHPAIISHSLFERVNVIVRSRSLGLQRSEEDSHTRDWIIKNVAHCAHCGGGMISVYSRTGSRYRRNDGSRSETTYTSFYYRCFARCTSRYVRVDEAERIAAEMVLARLVEWKDELARGPEPQRKGRVDFEAKRAVVARRRAKHIDAHGEGLISLDELREQLAKLDSERQKIDAAEAATGASARAREPAVRREMLRDLQQLEKRWRVSLPPTRRKIVNQLAKRIALKKEDGRVVVEPFWRTLDELVEDLGR